VRVCSFCVMDESNPAIEFDAAGNCTSCRDALVRKRDEWWPGDEGKIRMERLVTRLKAEGRGKKYDAVVGLSGGVDSAYVAHVAAHRHGLRLLAIHVDGGWNTEASVRNIESLVRGLEIDLYTYVVEWEEMRDLQVAFLKASVLNQDIPQDHAFFASMYRSAARFGVRNFLSGVNFATESIVPQNWGFTSMDGTHVRAIHRRFGHVPLDSYPIMPLSEYLWMTRVRGQVLVHRPLNYLNYNREDAKAELQRNYGWRDYGGKHGESRFTKFYQEIYLPRKFGFDKRRLHLSSLIVSGQMLRDQALLELAKPIITLDQARHDIKFVAKKLGLTVGALESLIDAPPVSHSTYDSQQPLHRRLTALKRVFRRSRRLLRNGDLTTRHQSAADSPTPNS
jgi:N-acetyl sugar amidotransferase